jgi:hypothetical protein
MQDPTNHFLDSLPEEVSYVRELALKYGKPTRKETDAFIRETASRQELRELQDLDNKILENGHLDILLEFVKDNWEAHREEAGRLNAFIFAIMPVPG